MERLACQLSELSDFLIKMMFQKKRSVFDGLKFLLSLHRYFLRKT